MATRGDTERCRKTKFIIFTSPGESLHAMRVRVMHGGNTRGWGSTKQVRTQERARSHEQASLLGIRMENQSKRHEGISWVCLNATRSQSGEDRK